MQAIGDLASMIHDCESQLLRTLENRVIDAIPQLQLLSSELAQYDVLSSFASVSLDYGYVRPDVVEDDVVFVKDAKHPLQALMIDGYVPNDIAVGAASNGRVHSRLERLQFNPFHPCVCSAVSTVHCAAWVRRARISAADGHHHRPQLLRQKCVP
jgi:hypothetical protein